MARIFLDRRDRDRPAIDPELHRLLDQLPGLGGITDPAADCTPPLDVVETAEAVELVMDLPGVALEDVTVTLVRDTLVIAGRKAPGECRHQGAAFHLAERTFGRFTRGVRLGGAFDGGRADARLRAGELRVTLPRIDERRGARPIRIARARAPDVRILFVGDIFGKPGREIARTRDPRAGRAARRSTSSSPTSRTRPPASASPATSPTPSSATAST